MTERSPCSTPRRCAAWPTPCGCASSACCASRAGHRDHAGRAARPVDRRDQLPPAASRHVRLRGRRPGAQRRPRALVEGRPPAHRLDTGDAGAGGRGLPARGRRPVRRAGRPLPRRVRGAAAAVARLVHDQRLAAAADRRTRRPSCTRRSSRWSTATAATTRTGRAPTAPSEGRRAGADPAVPGGSAGRPTEPPRALVALLTAEIDLGGRHPDERARPALVRAGHHRHADPGRRRRVRRDAARTCSPPALGGPLIDRLGARRFSIARRRDQRRSPSVAIPLLHERIGFGRRASRWSAVAGGLRGVRRHRQGGDLPAGRRDVRDGHDPRRVACRTACTGWPPCSARPPAALLIAVLDAPTVLVFDAATFAVSALLVVLRAGPGRRRRGARGALPARAAGRPGLPAPRPARRRR